MYQKTEQEIMKNWKGDIDVPIVSVCCTTYNHEPYIAEAIDGFLMQETDFPFEILIRDDCSTDKTAEIVKQYADKYPQLIKPVYEQENTYSKGVKPMQQLYKIAIGKYIAICEGDDYWTDPLKLQKQVDFLEDNPDYGLVYTNIDIYYHNENFFKKSAFNDNINRHKKLNFSNHLIHKYYLAPLTWVFNRNLIKYMDLKKHPDGTFSWMLDFLYHSKIYYMDNTTGVYRVSNGTASKPKDRCDLYRFRKGLFEMQKYYIEKYQVDEKIKEQIYDFEYYRLFKSAEKCNDNYFIDEIKEYIKSENYFISYIKKIILGNDKTYVILKKIDKLLNSSNEKY